MPILVARGENLRLYRRFEIQPHPRLNLVVGENAAGKTTLLEALYVTARGRSFRTASLGELSGSQANAWSTFLGDAESGLPMQHIGLAWNPEGTELRFKGQGGVSLATVIRALPLQMIDPNAHRMLDEGPAYRRSYVDWGVFHVEQSFHPIWRRFHRALKQRNKALKDGAPDRVIDAWNGELSETAEAMTALRTQHVIEAEPGFRRWVKRLLELDDVAYEWMRGWPQDSDYAEILERQREQHRRLGTTAQGPHRGELKITLDRRRARGRVSRGQQKLLIAAMVLAQVELIIAKGLRAPILLIDDFASELSALYQTRLIGALGDYPGQIFITAFELPPAFVGREGALFHVEHGEISLPIAFH